MVFPITNKGIYWRCINSQTRVTVATIDSVIISSTGDATDFGNLTYARGIPVEHPQITVRGVFGGGDDTYTIRLIT